MYTTGEISYGRNLAFKDCVIELANGKLKHYPSLSDGQIQEIYWWKDIGQEKDVGVGPI